MNPTGTSKLGEKALKMSKIMLKTFIPTAGEFHKLLAGTHSAFTLW